MDCTQAITYKALLLFNIIVDYWMKTEWQLKSIQHIKQHFNIAFFHPSLTSSQCCQIGLLPAQLGGFDFKCYNLKLGQVGWQHLGWFGIILQTNLKQSACSPVIGSTFVCTAMPTWISMSPISHPGQAPLTSWVNRLFVVIKLCWMFSSCVTSYNRQSVPHSKIGALTHLSGI